MAHTKSSTRGSDSSANRCTSQRPDAPASGGDSPSVEYNDLFGAPALGESDSTPEAPGTSADTPERDTHKDRPAEPPDGGRCVEHDDLFGSPALGDEPDPAPSTETGPNEPETGPDRPEADPDEPDTDPPAPGVDDLFGDRVQGSDPERDPFASNRGEPPAAPSLPFTAQPAQRALYQQAFRAAYRYPDALMLVMQGIRKGLKRGKEAARRKEDRSP